METLTLDNIDKHFSPELLALMGEWLTFFQVGKENGLSCDKVPTIRDFFETGRISANGAFSDALIEYGLPTTKRSVYLESFLKSYGVISDAHDDIENYRYLKPIIGYDDVRNTFRKNLSSGKAAIFPCFAWFSQCFMPQAESVPFSHDLGCRPLLEAFSTEGYIARRGETFHWTSKIRPMMEILDQWETRQELEAQAKKVEVAQDAMSTMDQLYEEVFEKSIASEDITPLINFVKEYPAFISFTASISLEDLRVATVIPIIKIVLLFNSLGSSVDPLTLAEDLSETGEVVKALRCLEFWNVIEVFMPKRIDLSAKRVEPSKTYKLPWGGDPFV